MRVDPEALRTAEAIGERAAGLVLDAYVAGRGPFLLGCPSGRSGRTTYAALARRVASEELDLTRLVVVMMDEYVVRDGDRTALVDPAAGHSCRRFALDEIVGPLNAAAPHARGVTPDRVWLPDPADPAAYDRRIADAGGVDVFLLACGSGDGHVALNPPGADPATTTRVVELPDSVRRDNLATFPSFGGDLAHVPDHGVTVGIATLRELSREVVMLLPGQDKAEAARRLTAATAYDPEWPATVLAECRRPHLLVLEGI